MELFANTEPIYQHAFIKIFKIVPKIEIKGLINGTSLSQSGGIVLFHQKTKSFLRTLIQLIPKSARIYTHITSPVHESDL
jgi:hypothetical protein